MRRSVLLLAGVIVLSCTAAAEPLATTPLAIEAIAREPAITSVALSPDGNHITALISRPEYRWPAIAIWETKDAAKSPHIIPAWDSHPFRVSFLGDRHILFQVDKPVGNNRFAQRWMLTVVTDLVGSKFEYPFKGTVSADDVPTILQAGSFIDPNRYLFQATSGRFGPNSIYTLDAETLRIEKYKRGARNFVQSTEDAYLVTDVRDGTLMVRENLRLKSDGWHVYREIRNRKTDDWEEHPELGYPVKDRRIADPLGFYDPDPNKLFVSTNLRSNFAAIWVYDIVSRTWESEPALESGQTDIYDLGPDIDWQQKRVLGARSYSARGLSPNTVFIDDKWAAVQRSIATRFPGQNVVFGGHDRAMQKVLVTVSGPKHPTAYYLLKDSAELTLLGKSRSWIDPAKLGETTARTYTARDGLSLTAFLTLPPGYEKARHGRIPLIVLPHGGPWARDNLDWDEGGWPQILATRGYAVVQPQFRGSKGWGMSLWKAGDRQWGLKMQDDLDDAVAWLAADGIADPSRVAMFGYSYAGYAAVVATMRGKPPYRCAIAGAPVVRVAKTSRDIGNDRILRELQAWTVDGFEPLEHVADMSIPLLLFHGTHDTNLAGTKTSEVLYNAMKEANKNVAYHPIKDMWHADPWYPEWKRETLTLIEQYLAGPKCFGANESPRRSD